MQGLKKDWNGSIFNLKFTFFSNVIQNYRSNFKNTGQKYDKIKYGKFIYFPWQKQFRQRLETYVCLIAISTSVYYCVTSTP